MNKPLDPAVVEALLAGTRKSKPDPTLIRDVTTWFQLNHHHLDSGCSNPDCVDTRPEGDKGRKIIIYLKNNRACCRYCYLSRWLLDE